MHAFAAGSRDAAGNAQSETKSRSNAGPLHRTRVNRTPEWIVQFLHVVSDSYALLRYDERVRAKCHGVARASGAPPSPRGAPEARATRSCYPARSHTPRASSFPLFTNDAMKRILFIFSALALFALCAEGAMVRVVAIENGRTITIEDRGTHLSVRLAGVAITDELRARELLRWTLADAWVMLERSGDDVLVYRSPDALFINRELVLRGCARATLAGIEPDNRPVVTYLGEVNPSTSAARDSRTGSDTSRRSRALSPQRTSGGSRRRSPAASGSAPRASPSSRAGTRAPRSRGSSH